MFDSGLVTTCKCIHICTKYGIKLVITDAGRVESRGREIWGFDMYTQKISRNQSETFVNLMSNDGSPKSYFVYSWYLSTTNVF